MSSEDMPYYEQVHINVLSYVYKHVKVIVSRDRKLISFHIAVPLWTFLQYNLCLEDSLYVQAQQALEAQDYKMAMDCYLGAIDRLIAFYDARTAERVGCWSGTTPSVYATE